MAAKTTVNITHRFTLASLGLTNYSRSRLNVAHVLNAGRQAPDSIVNYGNLLWSVIEVWLKCNILKTVASFINID